MGTKNKPGDHDAYAKAEPDEPVFTLLARDQAAPDLVREWAHKRGFLIRIGAKPPEDAAKVAEAIACAAEMEAWRAANRKPGKARARR